MEGLTLGSYTIERELGRGGMGAVYTAVHTLLGRRAAVKVLLAELSRNQDLVQRFFNEARAATAIKHPSIVEIYDFGWAPDGSAFIVMELMEGESLATRLARQRRLSVAGALTIARQIANALAAAHRAGIVHRDLKPDNVFLVADIEVVGGERVKLLDFGIAKLAAAGGAPSRTTTGAIMGTPLYMSPEQCEGARHVDHRTDLYALGCILFEMLAGRPPFQSEGVGGLIGAHLHLAPPALRSLVPDAPPEVEAIVARLLAKAPGDRHASADEVVAALTQVSATSAQVAAAPAALGLAATSPSSPQSPSSPSSTSSAASPPPSPPPPSSPSPSSPSPSSPSSFGPTAAAPTAAAPAEHRAPPPPTTLSGSSRALPAFASAAPPSVRRSRRGVWLALSSLAVAAAAAVTVVAVKGGTGSEAARAPAPVDAAAVAEVAVDAAAVVPLAPDVIDAAGSPADAALAAMHAAVAKRDWRALRLALDQVYDSTTDGDPLRRQADDLVAQMHELMVVTSTDDVRAHVVRGRCVEASRAAEAMIMDWGDPALPLRKLAATCKPAARVGDVRVPVDAGVSPPERSGPSPAEVVKAMQRHSGRLRTCAITGPVRLKLQLTISASGRVTRIVSSGDDPVVDTCIEGMLRTLQFPTTADGGTVAVPLTLSPKVPIPKPEPTTDPLEDPQYPRPAPGGY